VTNKTGFGFEDRIYWTRIQLVKTVHKSLSDTLSSSFDWTLHGNYSDFQLNSQSSRVESSRVESYVTTYNMPVVFSWNKAPVWGLRPDIYYCWTVVGLLMWGALPDEGTGVFYNCCWPSPAQSSSSLSPVGLATIIYCPRFETSLFVASYDSQGYSGGI
jgi:hypothetical protein